MSKQEECCVLVASLMHSLIPLCLAFGQLLFKLQSPAFRSQSSLQTMAGGQTQDNLPCSQEKGKLLKKTFACENVSLWMVFVDRIERGTEGRFSFSLLESSKKKKI